MEVNPQKANPKRSPRRKQLANAIAAGRPRPQLHLFPPSMYSEPVLNHQPRHHAARGISSFKSDAPSVRLLSRRSETTSGIPALQLQEYRPAPLRLRKRRSPPQEIPRLAQPHLTRASAPSSAPASSPSSAPPSPDRSSKPAPILNAPLLEYLIHHSASFGRPGAGPAIAISFVLVAIVCGFASVCYAELAAMIPIAGSAYTYTYATMGELIAWIIGWDLILEYAVSNMAVSVGFSAHIVDLLDWFGVHPNLRWITPAYLPGGLSDLQGNTLYAPGWHFGFNWPAFIIVMILTVILVRGIRESAKTNNIMVLLKIIAILVFITRRRSLHSSRQLASLRAQRLVRHPHRRLDRFLHLHRLRLRLHRRRRMQESATRSAHRHHRHAGRLHDALHRGRRGPHGLVPWQTLVDDAAPVVNTLEETPLRQRSPHRSSRRAHGHDLFPAGLSTRPGPRLVRHVARRPAARKSSAASIHNSARPIFPRGWQAS